MQVSLTTYMECKHSLIKKIAKEITVLGSVFQ